MKPLRLSVSLVFLVAGLPLAGCPDETAEKDRRDAVRTEFAEIRITDDADHLLFTYLLADGSFATKEKIGEVPEEARGQVIVVDTRLSPEKRQSSRILYVADLTAKRDDGTYTYSLVSRFEFERDLLRDPAASSGVLPAECKDLAASPEDRVVLYTTEWCGVCKAAAAFLTKEGIPFEEKDVERDRAAQQELACKALKAGTRLNGVPVLDVAGRLLVGFDRDRIFAAARKLKPRRKEPEADRPSIHL